MANIMLHDHIGLLCAGVQQTMVSTTYPETEGL